MPEIGVDGFVDLAQYDAQSNTRVRHDGQLELASKNEISGADFLILDKNGEPVNANLDAPSEPRGWAVFLQMISPTLGIATRQSLPVLPMEREIYTQIGPTIDGPGLPDANDRAKIARPVASRIENVSDGPGGFEVGWVAVAYGWIVSDTQREISAHVHRSPYITAPSPLAYSQITVAGECPVIPIPVQAPKGVVGIYLASTAPQSTQNAASLAQLWIQRRIDIRDGQQLTYTITGPFTREERAPATNKTAVGDFQQWAAPERTYGHCERRMDDFTTSLTWRFATPFGVSEVQNKTPRFHARYKGRHRELRWRPRNLPSNAIKWQPIFSRGDAYYGLPWRDVPQRGNPNWAAIHTNDPDKIKAKLDKIKYGRDGRDNTGIGNPSTEIDGVTKVGKPQLAVGRYRVFTAWYDDELMLTAPSPPGVDYATGNKYIDITALGQTIKVYRPQYGNAVPNSAGQTRDRTTTNNDPLDWIITRTANFAAIVTDLGQISVTDTSGSTATETFAQTPLTDILEDEPADRFYRARVGVEVKRYVSGRVGFRTLYYDKNKALLSTSALWGQVGNTANGANAQYVLNDAVYVRRRIAKASAVVPAGVTLDETIPTTARYFRIEAREIGAAAGAGSDGPRNFDHILTGFGAMRGLEIPRRIPKNVRPVPDIESYDDFYPPGGFSVIELNPRNSKRHADLAGINLNALLYFGPYGTPPHPDYGITGLATPVKPNTQHAYSVYAEYMGVYTPTNVFRLVCKDRNGRVVADYDYLIPNVAGTIAPTRFSKLLTIPSRGAWVEIAESNMSDGYWRVMAPQLELGSAATSWTNTFTSPGTRSFVFDLGAPGVDPESVNAFLRAITRLEAGATAAIDGTDITDTDYAGTSVSATYQTSPTRDPYFWSTPVADVTQCPAGEYLKINLTLTSSVPTLSPLVSRTSVEARRPYGVLLTSRGEEFPAGGCWLQSFPIVAGSRKHQEFVSDSNVYAQYISGEWAYRMAGVSLWCPSREAAEAVTAYRHSGEPFIFESLPRDRRITGFAPAIEFAPVDDGLSRDPLAPNGFAWEEQTAEVEVVVIEEDTLS